eukprot:13850534-Ditylum_brightwellii.AAC.1
MAQTKQTPRTGSYERLDIGPKDNKATEEDDAPKGINKQNLPDDVKETDKLGKKTDSKYKLDNKIDSGDNSDDSHVK